MKITHNVKHGEDIVVGSISGNDVIVLYVHENREPTVGMSTALPAKVKDAKRYLECMNAAFDKLDEVVNNR